MLLDKIGYFVDIKDFSAQCAEKLLKRI